MYNPLPAGRFTSRPSLPPRYTIPFVKSYRVACILRVHLHGMDEINAEVRGDIFFHTLCTEEEEGGQSPANSMAQLSFLDFMNWYIFVCDILCPRSVVARIQPSRSAAQGTSVPKCACGIAVPRSLIDPQTYIGKVKPEKLHVCTLRSFYT